MLRDKITQLKCDEVHLIMVNTQIRWKGYLDVHNEEGVVLCNMHKAWHNMYVLVMEKQNNTTQHNTTQHNTIATSKHTHSITHLYPKQNKTVK